VAAFFFVPPLLEGDSAPERTAPPSLPTETLAPLANALAAGKGEPSEDAARTAGVVSLPSTTEPTEAEPTVAPTEEPEPAEAPVIRLNVPTPEQAAAEPEPRPSVQPATPDSPPEEAEPEDATTPAPRSEEPAAERAESGPAPEPERAEGPGIVREASDGFQPPQALERHEPDYSREDVPPGRIVMVVLKVLVDENGEPTQIVVDHGEPGSKLVTAAIDAVLSMSYLPATEGGEPVRAWTREAFLFQP
jgi:protein TonB